MLGRDLHLGMAALGTRMVFLWSWDAAGMELEMVLRWH